MPVPTHWSDCETTIYSTRCQFCEEDVYFFTCTCGSRVFFDLDEPPWHPHERRCYKYLVWHYVEVEGTPIDQVSSLIEQYAVTTGLPIPEDLEDYLDELAAQVGRARERVTVVEPSEDRGQCSERLRSTIRGLTSLNASISVIVPWVEAYSESS